MSPLQKERFLAKKTKGTYLKIPIHHDNRDWMQKGHEGTAFLQEADQKSLDDTFFPGTLGFIHVLSNMSQEALAMWCMWYVSWSCIFYISEWDTADLPFDNVQLAGSALRLTVVISDLSVQPSHSLQSQQVPVCGRNWDYGPANYTQVCLLQMQVLPALLPWCKGMRSWGWNNPHPTLQDTVELHGLNSQPRQIKIQKLSM